MDQNTYGPEHFVELLSLRFDTYMELSRWCCEFVGTNDTDWRYTGARMWFRDPNDACACLLRFRGPHGAA